MSLLPSSPDIVPDTEPRVVGVDSEDADALMSALSSTTARRLLAELHDEPAPPSELADRADTTLQNTQYHLANLEEAGAVEVVGTAYSEKGREMDVYAPADQPLVIFAGDDEQASGLRAALARLLGGVAALGVGALVVQELVGRSVLEHLTATSTGGGGEPLGGAGGGGDGGAGGGDAAEPGDAAEVTETATPTEAAEDDAEAFDATTDPEATGTATEAGDAATTSAEGTGTPTPEAETGAEAETLTPEPEATEIATETAADTATPAATSTPTPVAEASEAVDGGVEAVASLPPGLLFFLGGLTVLLAWVLLAYR